MSTWQQRKRGFGTEMISKSKFYKNDPSPINSFLPGSLRRRKKKKISVNLINRLGDRLRNWRCPFTGGTNVLEPETTKKRSHQFPHLLLLTKPEPREKGKSWGPPEAVLLWRGRGGCVCGEETGAAASGEFYTGISYRCSYGVLCKRHRLGS